MYSMQGENAKAVTSLEHYLEAFSQAPNATQIREAIVLLKTQGRKP
jgi:hypothetical protein